MGGHALRGGTPRRGGLVRRGVRQDGARPEGGTRRDGGGAFPRRSIKGHQRLIDRGGAPPERWGGTPSAGEPRAEEGLVRRGVRQDGALGGGPVGTMGGFSLRGGTPRRGGTTSLGGNHGGASPRRGATRRAKRLDQQPGISVDGLCPQPKPLLPIDFGEVWVVDRVSH